MRGGPDVIVVGAGLYGLSAAWHLARRGASVVVMDGGDFASGGSGRNMAGFRMQWGLEFNIRLSQESIEFFEQVEERLDYPGGIECKQGGYLLLAHDEATLDDFRQAGPVHDKFNVPSEILAPDDIARLVPGQQVRLAATPPGAAATKHPQRATTDRAGVTEGRTPWQGPLEHC